MSNKAQRRARGTIILMALFRCLAYLPPLPHEPSPAGSLCELFLACAVVQKRGSSFREDVRRLKVKAVGTNLGFSD